MVSEIDGLKDENARLKGVVTNLERKATDQNVSVVHRLQVQRKVSRATIKSQDSQIARLTAIIESNKLTIVSQAAEIEPLSVSSKVPAPLAHSCVTTPSAAANATIQIQDIEEVEELERELQRGDVAAKRMDKILGRLKDENELAAGDLATIKKMMMPCYKVGFWIRQRNREEDWVRRGGKSSWFFDHLRLFNSLRRPSLRCQYPPLNDDFEEIDSTNTERWAHYKQQYHVPPNIVLENHHFSKFLEVLKGYANMQRYADEGSASAEEAAKFFKDSKSLIDKIYPVGVFKCDEDIERDPIADLLYGDLQDIVGAATIRYRTFMKVPTKSMGS
ncbi:hypothetical protein IFR05_012180 [Cadophora sp. M221]|nr:hypothetical protein IFR05_012180 [Cadophora sp. M221]